MTAMEALSGGELVSAERGEIDRRIFSDPEIFHREMKFIFGRSWLFIGHESQLREPGDFFEAPMGRDNVLVVRQRDGSIKALLNTCTHRGNAVCRAEEGNVRNFMCTYHGWTFDLAGNLVGVPGFNTFYAGELDKSKYRLRQAAQLDTYRGFIFATMDPTAPSLHDYLGRMGRLSFDLIAERGDIEVVPGIQKFVIDCNWKFTVDNVYDWYHPQITHKSAQKTGILVPGKNAKADNGGARTADGADLGVQYQRMDVEELVLLSEYGHAVAGPTYEARKANTFIDDSWRERPEVVSALGPVMSNVAGHPNIFPTCWIQPAFSQISLRVPRSPSRTEIWWFSFLPGDAPPDKRREMLFLQNHLFGPAGFLEQEDGENWAQSTMQTTGDFSRQIPQVLKMQLGRGKIIKEDGLARIESTTNEHAQLWTYLAWQEWMSGCSWDELRNRTTPPEAL